MDEKLLAAYREYADMPERQGIYDDSLITSLAAGKTVEEHIIDVLRAADMLPEEYRDEAERRRSA